MTPRRLALVESLAAMLLTLTSGCRRAPKPETTPSTHLAIVKGTLTWDDFTALRTKLPEVDAAAPLCSSRMPTIAAETNWATIVTGTTPEYFTMRAWPLARGAVFSESEVEAKAPVAVLGDTVAVQLFGAAADPVGQTIRLRNVSFSVIGVAASRGLSSVGTDQDDVVFVPVTVFRTKLQSGPANALGGVIVFSSSRLGEAMTAVESLLRDRHRLGPGIDSDFELRRWPE